MNYRVVFKNATANVVRGSAAALVAVLLPPFLTRVLPSTVYGTWVLVLQLSAYVAYLDFGIQTAVGRFVAHANELADIDQRDRIISTSFIILLGSALVGIFVMIVLAWQLPNIFHDMSPTLYPEARLSLLFIGCSLAIGLPFSVFNGVFIGLQRSEVPAVIIGGSKLVGAILVVVVAELGGGMVAMAAALASVNVASYIVQFVASQKLTQNIRISQRLLSKKAGRELLSYCFSLSIWSFSMLLISGLDTTLVGFFDFPAVAYYSVAATLVVFIVGLQAALFNALMPAAAVLSARSDAEGLGDLLVSSTRYGMFALLITGVPLVVFASDILTIWVGTEYALRGALLLRLLILANIIRLSLSPYAALLVGTGQQRFVIISPLVESFTNLSASVILGFLLGAVGVAIGTIVGSLVVFFVNIFYNMPRTQEIRINRQAYFKDGLLRPLFCTLPFIAWATIFTSNKILSPFLWGGSLLFSLIFTVGLLWYWGLITNERKWLEPYAIRVMRIVISRT